MYTDDLQFRSQSSSPPVPSPGANIKFAAMNIDTSALEWIVSSEDPTVPKPVAMLSQNFPNPFNPSTTIKFSTPKAGQVNLSVYNVRGQRVKTLVNEVMPAGQQSVTWNGDDNNSRSVASGVYFYKLEADGRTEVKRMVLMK